MISLAKPHSLQVCSESRSLPDSRRSSFLRPRFQFRNTAIKVYSVLLIAMICTGSECIYAQAEINRPAVPDWAQPGSPTHKQVPPPADFHRPSRNYDTAIGIFQGQSDIGAALVPGNASYDSATKQYTINSAGYNVWYTRDEFRYLWSRMSGDVSLAGEAKLPNPEGYGDRKAMLVIRQSLDDDSKEAVVAEHGTGMIHLAQQQERNAMMTDQQFRFGGTLAKVMAKRIGIEKHGDQIALFVSLVGDGEDGQQCKTRYCSAPGHLSAAQTITAGGNGEERGSGRKWVNYKENCSQRREPLNEQRMDIDRNDQEQVERHRCRQFPFV